MKVGKKLLIVTLVAVIGLLVVCSGERSVDARGTLGLDDPNPGTMSLFGPTEIYPGENGTITVWGEWFVHLARFGAPVEFDTEIIQVTGAEFPSEFENYFEYRLASNHVMGHEGVVFHCHGGPGMPAGSGDLGYSYFEIPNNDYVRTHIYEEIPVELSSSQLGSPFYTEKGGEENVYIPTVNNISITVLPFAGDVNNDGVVNIVDVVYLQNFLFYGGPTPVGHHGNVNGDNTTSVADLVYLINYLFKGRAAPMDWPIPDGWSWNGSQWVY